MKKIIVPIDFSEQSEYALKVAASLSNKHGSEIFVLHMLELSDAVISSSEGMLQQEAVFFLKLAEKKFNTFLDKPYLEGIKITPIVKHFKVFSEVNEVAKKHDADLVIIGSHGADGLKEIFVGSNAERVVRTSDIPVLVIKNDIEDFKIEHFVFACDYKEENIVAFKKALDFANKLSAELHMVYINIPGDGFLSTESTYERITAFLQKANIGKEVEIYNDYSVEKGVLNYSKNVNADIIAIPTHGHRGLVHFFRGSIGEDIANHSKIPVVTFKI